MILYDIHKFLTQHGGEHTCMTTHTHTPQTAVIHQMKSPSHTPSMVPAGL